MAEHPKKKIQKFSPKKSGASIVQSTKKRAQVPISIGKKKTNSVNSKSQQKRPVAPQIPNSKNDQDASAPFQYQPPPQPVNQPSSIPVAVKSGGHTTQSNPPNIPAVVPLNNPASEAPPPIQKGVIPLAGFNESVHAPTQANIPEAYKQNKKNERTVGHKVLTGKPVTQDDVEDLKDEVASYLEVCDSCLSDNNSVKDIVDVVHMFVRSLNFDVLTIAALDDRLENLISGIASRGYNNPPNKAVLNCWEKSVIKGKGIDWKILMKIAGDTHSELAYWIVQEGLDSIGYVPVRDNNTIYGFIFVAAMQKKKQSPLSSLLLDACGSRIGMTYSKYGNSDWPESVMNLAKDIRNQFSLIMGYLEMIRDVASSDPEKVTELIQNCNKTIMESTQMMNSMVSEAVGN